MLNEEIRKLDELREQGIISDEEYELKKEELYNTYSSSNNYTYTTSSNKTTSTGSKKFEIFASVSYFLGIPSIIFTALASLFIVMGIFFGLNGYNRYESAAIAAMLGYVGFIFSAISLNLSIPALIFGKISSKGVIVNFNRSKTGTTLSLISLIASIVLIVIGLMALVLFTMNIGSSYHYNYF